MAVRCSATHYIGNFADIEFPADFVDAKDDPTRIRTNKNQCKLDTVRDVKKGNKDITITGIFLNCQQR